MSYYWAQSICTGGKQSITGRTEAVLTALLHSIPFRGFYLFIAF